MSDASVIGEGPVTADHVTDAAERLLREGGFDAMSVRAVGERLGVSRQVVYTHFGGVDGLLDALHERASGYLAGSVGAGNAHRKCAVGSAAASSRTTAWISASVRLPAGVPVAMYGGGSTSRTRGKPGPHTRTCIRRAAVSVGFVVKRHKSCH